MVVHGDLFDVGKAQCSNVHCNEAHETQSPLSRDHDIVRAVERSVFFFLLWLGAGVHRRAVFCYGSRLVAERQPMQSGSRSSARWSVSLEM